MAYRKNSGGSGPTHYIAITAKVGKGKYEKGPYVGLWEGAGERNSPLFRGSAKGKYLDEVYDFVKEFGEEEVGFAIFESRGDRGSKRRDDSDRDDSDRDDRGSRRGSSRDRDGEKEETRSRRNEKEDEPRGKSSRRSSREEEAPRGRGGKEKAGKKDWFDD